MATEAEKDALIKKFIWSATRVSRIWFWLMFCFGVLVAEGIFGRGWESGAFKAVVTVIMLAALEILITIWKNR